ncbi:MAG: DUF2723 domain-containing protein [Bacteroidia bacterium]|nr:DUF2723 domain-containing protein [Bacteroidia bacterium]
MNNKTFTNLTGWAVFATALVVYSFTAAPTASFWDCGEFIACSNELEVTHPPGAPLFLLLGRLFSMLAWGDVYRVASLVNMLSVIASAATAMFTCWITMYLAEKGLRHADWDASSQRILGAAAGVVAGLTCTFADSIWFNAVEAEVYALSSTFTAAVVWLMLKWDARADEPDHFRWIVLIAYVMGLSMGVHLLNLLAIPALACIYYFRKFSFSWPGFLLTMGISVAILAVIQYGIIQYTFSLAWEFEKWMTGTRTLEGADTGLGLPIGTGAGVFALLLIGILATMIWWSHRTGRAALNTVMLSVVMIYLGFASYSVIFVRSRINPPVDMNNPENILTFLSYMKREQYGERPLLWGPMYNSRPETDSRGYPKTRVAGMKYILPENGTRYVADAEDIEYLYPKGAKVLLPRMWEPGHYRSGPFAYANYVQRKGTSKDSPYDDKPTRGEDISFFLEYQLNHMYLRYFLWNFVGRTSDVQEAGWEDGLILRSAIYADNKANNHYYFLPLFFGLLGLMWQLAYRRNDAAVVGLLFFFTGIAIIIYLNQYPLQPRERDYSFAGSFQTFAIWVGLGVVFWAELLKRYLGSRPSVWVAAALTAAAPLLMGSQNWDDHTRRGRLIDVEFARNLLNTCAPDAILFTGGDNDTFPLWYVQEVEGFRTDVRVVNLELLISDWYIDQMLEPKNQAAPLQLSMRKADYAGEANLVIYDYPSQQFVLPADKTALVQAGVLTPQEAAWAADSMVWDFQASGSRQNSYILRKDSVLINLVKNVARDGWKRPVYFANTMPGDNFAGLEDYLRLEGMAYRLVPVRRSEATPNDIYYGWVAQDRMYDNLTSRFAFTGLDDPHVYLDEHIRGVIIGNYRNTILRLGATYAAQIDQIAIRQGDTIAITGYQDAETRPLQDKVRALYQFSEAKIPVSVTPKPLSYMLAEMQMLEQARLIDVQTSHARLVREIAFRELEQVRGKKVQLNPDNISVRAVLLLIRFYLRAGNDTEARTLADQLMTTTGLPIGKQYLDQELQQRVPVTPAP